ncbi:MAG: hypothetical protein LC648_08765 [Novosphingobium sp.]|nr:hypothetical protein [Novosphingobium sp.]
MKKLLVTITACLAVPGIAFAAEPPAKPKECCCEKMKETGKDCCPEKDKMKHEGHGDHKMDAPKT